MPPVTSRVPGNGSTSISYTIPGSGLDVETVRVSVDATAAAGAVTATVTITDQSGVVIATKPQNATIPAGAIGSATWALRLDDDTAGGGGADPLAVHFDTTPSSGTFLDVETTGGAGMAFTAQGNTNIDLTAHGTGTEQITLSTDAGEVLVESATIVERISPAGGHYRIRNSSGGTIVDVLESGDVTIRLESGGVLDVLGPFSRPILRVTDGGGGIPTYQGKTGGAWVFNL